MIRKLIKASAIFSSSILVIFGILYIIGPYLIKSRMAKSDPPARHIEYAGVEGLPKDGTILFVTAHPDDLEFMSGGTLPLLLKRNNAVCLVLLTDGGKQRYMPAFYSKRIVDTRRREQLEIAEIEGLKGVFFFNYPDGSLKFSEEAIEKVEDVANKVGATDIFTFEPGKRDGYYDTDHDAAGQIGTAVAKRNASIKGLYYFSAEEPNIVVDISDNFEKKLDTLFMFTEFKYKRRMLRAIHQAWDSSTGQRIGVRYAEGFLKVDLLNAEPKSSVEPEFMEEKSN